MRVYIIQRYKIILYKVLYIWYKIILYERYKKKKKIKALLLVNYIYSNSTNIFLVAGTYRIDIQ
jgi:hypothetical protein